VHIAPSIRADVRADVARRAAAEPANAFPPRKHARTDAATPVAVIALPSIT